MAAMPRRRKPSCGRVAAGSAAAVCGGLWLGLLPLHADGQGFGGFGGLGAPRLGNCPESGPWPGLLQEVLRGADLFRAGELAAAKEVLSTAAEATTLDVREAFGCSLGIASLYRALAFAYCTDPSLEGRALRRANQIGLRFLHVAMNWLTHTFVSTNHDQPLIDGSAWPIGIQEINEDLNAVASALRSTGPLGHAPTKAGARVPHDYSRPELRIAIVSLCAYEPDHPLPRYSVSNQGLYAERHGYSHVVERNKIDNTRPPAWGKVKLMEREAKSGKWDWVVWADCDTYFMNMSITLESVLFTYAGQEPSTPGSGAALELDPKVHMIVSEDAAMLNTGIFFMRSSDWSLRLLSNVWGAEDSPWINHPWWENAAFAWEFLKDNPPKFKAEDHRRWAERGEDDMADVYPAEVRIAPQSHFNSYHPITSRFLHDTWEEGKFVIAFNGVLSASSPTVVRVLYGSYYQTACQLNGVEHRCVSVDAPVPWERA